MTNRAGSAGRRTWLGPRQLGVLLVLGLLSGLASASVGDRLPEFKECVEICKSENCGPNGTPTPIPFHRRLLFWTCSSECDYTCQHIITSRRTSASPPQPVVQFHGKWPFHRALGVQEPASVLFSALNLAAHYDGLRNKVLRHIHPDYPMRPYYVALACVGMASWVFSVVFHTRDFVLTERLDYFGAGANVLYGLYYSPIRIFHLAPAAGAVGEKSLAGDRGRKGRQGERRRRSMVRLWTLLCLTAYAAHVGYLSLVRFDYSYNMAANVVVGVVQNALWTWWSVRAWRRSHRSWAVWPGLVVAWVIMAMSLELLDFPPLWGVLDAHSLWHAGTIAPTVLWYNFLVKDAADDMAGEERLKA